MNTIALLASSLLAAANPFAPMDFLAGKCWTTALPDGTASDTHCFAWLYPGHFLRDTHVVCAEGAPVYTGETTYGLEPGTQKLRWRYMSVLGLTIDGHVEPDGDALRFTGRYLSGVQMRDVRATWSRTGDGYRAVTEERSGDEPWKTQSDLEFKADARTAPTCGGETAERRG